MANSKEAKARIKINKLLEASGWRFFDTEKGQANIQLEPNVKITQKDIDAFGEDFETTKNGFIDFLLLDEKGFPLVILEAKKGEKNPLDGKEQARRYAKSENARFVILSNGNLHYFWDLERINRELKRILIEAFEEVYEIAKERKIPLRVAAYIIAINRLAKAIELRGIFP